MVRKTRVLALLSVILIVASLTAGVVGAGGIDSLVI